jgi:hypothetical protein
MRRKKKTRRGWRKKKRKPALASSIPGFVAVLRYSCSETYNFISTKQGFNLMQCVSVHGHTKDHPAALYNLPILPSPFL